MKDISELNEIKIIRISNSEILNNKSHKYYILFEDKDKFYCLYHSEDFRGCRSFSKKIYKYQEAPFKYGDKVSCNEHSMKFLSWLFISTIKNKEELSLVEDPNGIIYKVPTSSIKKWKD